MNILNKLNTQKQLNRFLPENTKVTYPFGFLCSFSLPNPLSLEGLNKRYRQSFKKSYTSFNFKTRCHKAEPQPKARFRLSCKRLFLTYSRVPENLDKETVLRQLQQALNVKHYAISEERHQNGEKHFHVVLEAFGKFNIKRPEKVTVHFEDKSFPGHHERVRRIEQVLQYISKEGDIISNFPTFKNGKFVTFAQDIVDRVLIHDRSNLEIKKFVYEEKVDTLLKTFNITNLDKTLDSIRKFKEELNACKKQQQEEENEFPLKLHEFNRNAELIAWENQQWREIYVG